MSEYVIGALIGAIAVIVAAVIGRNRFYQREEKDDERTKKLLKQFLTQKPFKERKFATLRSKTRIYDHDRLRSLLRSIGAHAVENNHGEELWTLRKKR